MSTPGPTDPTPPLLPNTTAGMATGTKVLVAVLIAIAVLPVAFFFVFMVFWAAMDG